MQEIERLKKQLGTGGISSDIAESSEELESVLEKAREK